MLARIFSNRKQKIIRIDNLLEVVGIIAFGKASTRDPVLLQRRGKRLGEMFSLHLKYGGNTMYYSGNEM